MPDTAKLASPPSGVLKKPSQTGTAGETKEEWISMDKNNKQDNNKDSGGGKDSNTVSAVKGGKQSRFQVAKVDFAKGSKDEDRHSSSDEDDHAGGHGGGGGGVYSNSSYDTHNMRSLHHYTREALPRLDHYRNVMSVHGHMNRPTLDELHNATLSLLPEKEEWFL
ncbi:solute carrier family 12 member 2-like [Tropilaelaps mercedesae]|uniref:Solute carrier family 12 member 2-like n=1 Tax=Tropilaelaps mercedesae TaxID=418985 RepID=A0A1V9Y138_9ACAR|nr:solute carrier family 12 member 2-like [Tropilaelaps mercedesae]